MRTAEDFLLEISVRPEDLPLRAVFADWLLERGDPRGEFIVLQLKANPSPLERERERQLFSLHGKAWLPLPLQEVIAPGSHRYQQGVLSACRIKPVREAQILAAQLDPQWATVRELASPPFELIEQCPLLESLTDLTRPVLDEVVLFHAPRPRLRELSGRFSPRALQAISAAEGWPALSRLGIWGSSGQSTVDRQHELRAIDELDLYAMAPPRQDRSFRPTALGGLLMSPLARQLSRLELGTGYVQLATFLDELEAVDTPLRELVLRDSAMRGPEPDAPGRWGISLRRGPRGWRSLAILPGDPKHTAADEDMVRAILSAARPNTFHDVQLPRKNHLRAGSLPCTRKAAKRYT